MMFKKLKLLFLLLLAIPALAQTSKNGRIQVGPLAAGPGLPLPCAPSDQWNTNDGHGAYICVTTNNWQQIGGGGTNYQTIETAGTPLIQEPKLNFVNIPCVDNAGNNSTDCTASYQFVLNNASVLPQEPRWNAVPPFTCADNAANTRTDCSVPSAVGVGGSHSSGLVPDPGAFGTGTDYLGRDMNYHTSVSAGTILPDPSVNIQYVAKTCNGGGACSDANDGLSWGNAKLTIYTAICSLPAGNCGTQTAGGGTVYVANGVTANPTSGAGIWLMGPNDPNFASPPAGWLKQNNVANGLAIIGVGQNNSNGPNGHIPKVDILSGSQTDNNHPAVWLSAWVANVTINNIYPSAFNGLPGRAVVIGECSNQNRTTCTSTGAMFYNDDFAPNTSSATAGPCADITGYSFWIWFEHSGCNGNADIATGGRRANNAAAWLIDGAYLITISDSNSASGGIKAITGPFGIGLTVTNFTEESDGNLIPPAVWFSSTGNWSPQSHAYLQNVAAADGPPGSDASIENDAVWGTGGPTVASSPGGVSGTAYVLNPEVTGQSGTLTNPMLSGWTGTVNRYMVGQSNIARRLSGLNAAVYANQLSTDPVFWQAASGSSGVTAANVADPFGGNVAGKITVASGTQQLSFGPPYPAWSGATGDWVVGGVFVKNWSLQSGGLVLGPCPTNGGGTFSTTMRNDGELITSPTSNSDQWDFVWAAGKVASVTGANVCLIATVVAGNNPVFYGPVEFFIPASVASDDEVAEFASTMGPVDRSCPVGSMCNVSGHPLNLDTLNLRSTRSFNVGSLIPATLTGNRTYTFPDASGIPGLFTGTITPGNNICASGAIGLMTTVGCTGGGGGGNVTNALLNSFAIYTAAGNSNVIGGVPGPITPANVPQFLMYTPNGTTSGAPTTALAGIPVRTFSGSPSDTVAATDRNSQIFETFGGAVALNVSSTLFNSGFAFKLGSRSTNSVVTVTPSSGTCNGSSTCTISQGQNAVFTLDAAGTNLMADIHDPPITSCTGCTVSRGDYGIGLTVTGAVGGTGTSGSLAKWTGTTTVGNGDLSGDVTTAGTLVATVPSVNGVTYQAGGALSANRVPVTTGASATTYQQVPAAAIAGSGVTTVNNQSCTIGGANCNVNTGAPTHGIALNEGNGAAISGIAALTVNQIPVGVASADPVAGNLSELSATLYGPTDSGTSTAFAACSTPAAAALHPGQLVEFKPAHANTSNNPTLAWCGLTPATIVSIAGNTLANNDIITTQDPLLLYDGTNFELQNPQTNIISAAIRWDQIGNPNVNKTFSNGAFTTTFNQTSNVAWSWANTTAAASTVPQSAPTFNFLGQYGSSNLTDTWTLASIIGTQAGVNPSTTLTITHPSGTSGAAAFQVVPNTIIGNQNLNLGSLTIAGGSGSPGSITLAGTGATPGTSFIGVNTLGTTLSLGSTNVTIGTTNPASVTTNGPFVSTVATGTAPLTVSSTTQVANLNAATLGGINLGTPVAGGIGYGVTTIQIGTTTAGTAKQVVLSGGTGTPTMIDFPERYYIPAANCNNTLGGAGWSIPSGGTVSCRAGTNNLGGFITITDTSTTFAQFTLTIPEDWDTGTRPYIRFYFASNTDTTNGHTVIPQIKVSCPTAGDGSTTDDATFSAAQSSSTVTFGASAVAHGFYNGSNVQIGATQMTGCIQGGLMIVQVGRATDTATGNINFYGADVTFPRLLTVGAE